MFVCVSLVVCCLLQGSATCEMIRYPTLVGAREQWSQGAMEPGTEGPRDAGTQRPMEPGGQGAREPGNQGARVWLCMCMELCEQNVTKTLKKQVAKIALLLRGLHQKMVTNLCGEAARTQQTGIAQMAQQCEAFVKIKGFGYVCARNGVNNVETTRG